MRSDHDGDRGLLRAARCGLTSRLFATAACAETVEIEPLVIHLEIVAIADAAEHRAEDGLVDVLDALAARADQVVVMLGDARDVGGYVTRSLEPRRHARFDLRLEGAVDRGEAQTGISTM